MTRGGATPTELALPGDVDPTGAVEAVAARIGAASARPHVEDLVLLDTFDRRLRAAGLAADHPAGRSASIELRLHEAEGPVRRATVAAAASYPAAALPAGPLRDRLAPVLEERALIPVARVRIRRVGLAVENADTKTVVRVEVEHPAAVVRGRGTVALTPRVVVRPVRGYDKAFERTLAALDLVPAASTLRDEAVEVAGTPGPPPGVTLERGMRADVAAGLVLAQLAAVAEANVPGTLADLDPEFLHDLRVSIRRARSVLRELRGVFPPERRAALREELRWAQALTGPVRDLDVQLLGWEALAGDRAAELEPLRELLVRHREREFRALRRGLRGRRFRTALEDWKALALVAPAEPDDPDRPRAALTIDVVAADRIHRVRRRMIRDGKAIDDTSPDTDLHELRKRGKELRYLLELFGGVYGGGVVKPAVKALKQLQDVLGEFQDLHVQAARLREGADELARRPGGTDPLLAAGRLIAGLEARMVEVRAEFDAHFAAFAARRIDVR
jgi:CHAD domain-containing protein